LDEQGRQLLSRGYQRYPVWSWPKSTVLNAQANSKNRARNKQQEGATSAGTEPKISSEDMKHYAPGVGFEPTISLVLPLHVSTSLNALGQQTTLKQSSSHNASPQIRTILLFGTATAAF
jgi:hypothetical protein